MKNIRILPFAIPFQHVKYVHSFFQLSAPEALCKIDLFHLEFQDTIYPLSPNYNVFWTLICQS
jgi:hypothetical protein